MDGIRRYRCLWDVVLHGMHLLKIVENDVLGGGKITDESSTSNPLEFSNCSPHHSHAYMVSHEFMVSA